MTMSVALALVPIMLLIGFGVLLRQRGLLSAAFWPEAERLGYFILLPMLFFHGLATARLDALPIAGIALTLVVATLAVAGAVVALRPLMRIDGPGFTSVFQGSVRFNNYVGVTLAAGLFGAEGVALAAICNAVVVPLVNVLCVLVFARHGAVRQGWRGVGRQIATNPLVMGCAGGMLFQLLGLRLPEGVEPALRVLGAAALPVGLLCVGAALDFGTARQWIGPLAAASSAKFVALPLVTLAFGIVLGLEGTALLVALLFQAMPTASSAYVMARQLGGDAPLMAGITAGQTVLAAIAVPLMLGGLFDLVAG